MNGACVCCRRRGAVLLVNGKGLMCCACLRVYLKSARPARDAERLPMLTEMQAMDLLLEPKR